MLVILCTIILMIGVSIAIKLKKTKLLIGLFIIIVLLFCLFVDMHYYFFSRLFNKGKNLEEITNIKFENISHVESDNKEYDLQKFRDEFENKKLKKHRDIEDIIYEKLIYKQLKFAEIRSSKYVCFDENENELFYIEVCGGQPIYYVIGVFNNTGNVIEHDYYE